ncbi:MAG TPA: hypothetical protein VNT55_25105, partial [Baekduia sp.]|nr:hypothetical protein [Baekduia sp.]
MSTYWSLSTAASSAASSASVSPSAGDHVAHAWRRSGTGSAANASADRRAEPVAVPRDGRVLEALVGGQVRARAVGRRQRDQRRDALGRQDRRGVDRARAPVVAGQDEGRQPEPLGEVEHVGAERR